MNRDYDRESCNKFERNIFTIIKYFTIFVRIRKLICTLTIYT